MLATLRLQFGDSDIRKLDLTAAAEPEERQRNQLTAESQPAGGADEVLTGIIVNFQQTFFR